MKYRPHTGGFDESMAQVIEVTTLEELKKEIQKTWELEIVDVCIEHYYYDPRNMWDTHIVKVEFENEGEHWPIGFSDGEFKDTPDNPGSN